MLKMALFRQDTLIITFIKVQLKTTSSFLSKPTMTVTATSSLKRMPSRHRKNCFTMLVFTFIASDESNSSRRADYDYSDLSYDNPTEVIIRDPSLSEWYIGIYGWTRCEYTLTMSEPREQLHQALLQCRILTSSDNRV